DICDQIKAIEKPVDEQDLIALVAITPSGVLQVVASPGGVLQVVSGFGQEQKHHEFFHSLMYEKVEGCNVQGNSATRSPSQNNSESCMGIRSMPSMVAPGVRRITHLPTIVYRPIRPSDLEVLKEIHKALFPIRYESEFFLNVVNGRGIVSWAAVDTSKPDAHGDELIGFVTARVVVASESEAEDMLGYDMVKTDRTLVYILTLGVIKPYRNLGIASALVWEVIEYALSIPSCRAVYLHVISYNQSAIHFYKKNSFQCLRKLQNFYYINGCHYDAYLYVYYVNGGRAPCSALDFLAAVGAYIRRLCHSLLPNMWKNEENKGTKYPKCKEV
ncbi:hypothetical protein KI387_009556, partial [Taxus chinensis]